MSVSYSDQYMFCILKYFHIYAMLRSYVDMFRFSV